MNAYLLLPLLAAVASTVLSVAILAQDPRSRLNRRAALLVGGAAWWALCEVLWNSASEPGAALALVRLSCLGWVALGPLGLEVLLEVSGRPARRERRALPWLYAASAAYAALVLAGGIHTRAVPTAWGWGYELSRTYLLFYPFVTGCLVVGLHAAFQTLRSSASPAERAQLRWVGLGVTVPLVVASATDGILPLLGVQVLHLATSSFAFLGATVAWSFHRYGYSLFAPSAFAREILDTFPDGVALLTLDGRIRTVNPALARLLGRDAEDLAGRSLAERLAGARLDGSDEPRAFEGTLESFGAGTIPVSANARTLYDRQGLPFGRVLVLRDTREVAELRRRLVTAGRLAAVGELAAGIAHEINNPIAFVGSNLHTLREYWVELGKLGAESPERGDRLRDGEELIAECLEGIERVKGIVHDVKGFAHAGEERSFVDVNGLLESALRVARPLLPRAARIEQILSDVPDVWASARHLQQVFLNLITNAAHAIGEAGNIRLETRRGPGGVWVGVADDGCGIPEELLDRVFDPFFTTKGAEGTGLGLAISYQIVRSHGGEIGVESEPGGGTRVWVFLPAEGAPEGSGSATQTAGPGGR